MSISRRPEDRGFYPELDMDELDNVEWDEFVLTLAREQGIIDFQLEVEEAQNG